MSSLTPRPCGNLARTTGETTSWTYDAAGKQTRDGSGLAFSYGVRSQARYIGGKANTNFAVGNTEPTATAPD